jgi:hypothetical protein
MVLQRACADVSVSGFLQRSTGQNPWDTPCTDTTGTPSRHRPSDKSGRISHSFRTSGAIHRSVFRQSAALPVSISSRKKLKPHTGQTVAFFCRNDTFFFSSMQIPRNNNQQNGIFVKYVYLAKKNCLWYKETRLNQAFPLPRMIKPDSTGNAPARKPQICSFFEVSL